MTRGLPFVRKTATNDGAHNKRKKTASRSSAIAMASTETMEEFVNAQGLNTKALFCRECGSQFISEEKAEQVEHEQSQLHFQQLANANNDSPPQEISSVFWKVPSVWDFDNIAQTRKVEISGEAGAKPNVYLLCGDCEKGPVAVRWNETEPFYISHSKVLYERPEGAPQNGALPAGMSEDFVRSLIAQQEQQQQQQQQGESGY